MRLYRMRFSTNVERVTLALAHKGLEVESCWITPQDRVEVVRISGQPLVPVLVDGDRVIPDSTAILEYLDARHPPPLYPTEPARRAELRVFIEWFNEVWKRPPNEIAALLAEPEPDSQRVEELARMLQSWLGWFESLLAGREYLFGEFSAADCIAFPFLKYARAREPEDDELFHQVLERYQRLDGRHPRLAAWIARMDERPRV